MEQVPEKKSEEELVKDVESACCLCQSSYSQYRGQHKCAIILPSGLACAVPVIVCDSCQDTATNEPHQLKCPLCVKGYQTPNTAPDLVGQKRKLGLIERGGTDVVTGQKVHSHSVTKTSCTISRRVFLSKLPLTITASKLRNSFKVYNCNIESVHWIVDHTSGAFYGSAYVYMATMDDAQRVQELNGYLRLLNEFRKKGCGRGRKKQPRFTRVAFAPLREKEVWPPLEFDETEYPPIGC